MIYIIVGLGTFIIGYTIGGYIQHISWMKKIGNKMKEIDEILFKNVDK